MKKFDFFVELKHKANKILDKHHQRIVSLPDTSLMPCEHMDVCDRLGDRLDEWLSTKLKDSVGVKIALSTDEVSAVRMALLIYDDILMDIHRDLLKKELKMIIYKAIVEAEAEAAEK